MIQVSVEGIGIDQGNRTLVLLRDAERTRVLPIWIGPMEAVAIALELDGRQAPRPLTHDLLVNILNELEVKLIRVVVSDFRDSTFFATLTISDKNGVRHIDARPSDAIALALRTHADIFVEDEVIRQTGIPLEEGSADASPEEEEESSERIQRFMKLIEGVHLEHDAENS